MSKLTIHKTDKTRPGRGANPTDRVLDLYSDRIRVAVESAPHTRMYVYFRAKETAHDRSEQYIAEYRLTGSQISLSTVYSAIRDRVEEDWGYRLVFDDSGTGPFNALKDGGGEPPGSETDRRILRELIKGQGAAAAVGVANDRAAVSLLRALARSTGSVAVQQRDATTVNTDFDLYIRPDAATHGQIENLGEDDRWNRARRRIDDRAIDEKVETIQRAVTELSNEHGLSNQEIGELITERVMGVNLGQSLSSGSTDRGVKQGTATLGQTRQSRSDRSKSPKSGAKSYLRRILPRVFQSKIKMVALFVIVVVLISAAAVFLPSVTFLSGGGGGGDPVAGGGTSPTTVGGDAGGGTPTGTAVARVPELTAFSVSDTVTAGGNATVTVQTNEATNETVTVEGTAAGANWTSKRTVTTNENGTARLSIQLPTAVTNVTLTAAFASGDTNGVVTDTVRVGPAAPSRLAVFTPERAGSQTNDSAAVVRDGSEGVPTTERTRVSANDSVSVLTNESVVVAVALRDRYGNRVRTDETLNVTSAGDAVRVVDGNDTGTPNASLRVTNGTATVELVATEAGVNTSLVFTDDGLETTVAVATRRPAVSPAVSRVVFRNETASNDTVVTTRNLVAGGEQRPVVVDNDTTLRLAVQLNTSGGTPVTAAAVDANVTANRSAAVPTLRRLDGVNGSGDATATFRLAARPTDDTRYEITLRFNETVDAADPVERTVSVVVTRPSVNFPASSLVVDENTSVSLSDPTPSTNVTVTPDSVVDARFQFRPDNASRPTITTTVSNTTGTNETPTNAVNVTENESGSYRVAVGDADPGTEFSVVFDIGDERAATVRLNVTAERESGNRDIAVRPTTTVAKRATVGVSSLSSEARLERDTVGSVSPSPKPPGCATVE